MGHPDLRVRNKVFATLGWPADGFAMLKLTPDQQTDLVASRPEVFEPVPGGWGKRGATRVRLEKATGRTLKPALLLAWKNQSNSQPQ